MKSRLLLIAILAVGLTALYMGIARPQVSTIPSKVRESLVDLKPPPPPPIEPPALVIPPIPTLTPPLLKPVSRTDPISGRLEVPIQTGTTIDFSTGAPVVKVQGPDQEALERAIKEIAEATKATGFEAKK